jgi:hypothetical protein
MRGNGESEGGDKGRMRRTMRPILDEEIELDKMKCTDSNDTAYIA